MTRLAIARALDPNPFPDISPYLIMLMNKPRTLGDSVVWR
jgi:hypothetical protein